jgi:hypothetical protein
VGDGIKVNHQQILKLADILQEEVCGPLEEAAKTAEEAEPNAFNWGAAFNAMFGAHAEVKDVVIQNIKSWSEKTAKEEFGEKLGITAAIWKEAEEKSTPKKTGE